MLNEIIKELEAKIAEHKVWADECKNECDIDGMTYHTDYCITTKANIEIIKQHEGKINRFIEWVYVQTRFRLNQIDNKWYSLQHEPKTINELFTYYLNEG